VKYSILNCVNKIIITWLVQTLIVSTSCYAKHTNTNTDNIQNTLVLYNSVHFQTQTSSSHYPFTRTTTEDMLTKYIIPRIHCTRDLKFLMQSYELTEIQLYVLF